MTPSHALTDKEAEELEQERTRADAGRLGGKTTKKRYGSDFFKQIGRSGGKARGKKQPPINGK